MDIPPIGFGTHLLREEEAYNAVYCALTCGYRLIDTATIYRNEEHVGRAIRDFCEERKHVKREDIFLVSKLSPREQGYEAAKKAVEESLERLQVSYIDLYLIHWPGKAKLKPGNVEHKKWRRESWEALEELCKEQKLRYIGVSNYTVRHMEELLAHCNLPPFVNQVEMHPRCTQIHLAGFCRDRGVRMMAYSPLGCGEMLNNNVIVNIAKKMQQTPSSVLLAWARQVNGAIAIPRSTKVDHMKANLESLALVLDQNNLDKLSALDDNCHYCWDPSEIA
tara:strand:+ start:568 stop:1401 length:834 start_codon:yes stop_codon:yes gene_type:complete